MRDGIRLAADLYLPAGNGPWPTLVERLPYGKGLRAAHFFLQPDAAAEAGFATLVQDCRGRFDSDGEWYPFHVEIDDGYDTVEWAAAQPWSTGRVGLFGGSGHGATQWLAAMADPPHLAAMAPLTATADFSRGWLYETGGALALSTALAWALWLSGDTAVRRGLDSEVLARAERHVRRAYKADEWDDFAKQRHGFEEIFRSELAALLADPDAYDTLREAAPWFDDWLAHDDPDDPYWAAVAFTAAHAARSRVPTFEATGWYDFFLYGTLRNHALVTGAEDLPIVRGPRVSHHLTVGPWAHGAIPPDLTSAGEIDFGPLAAVDLQSEQLAWFAHHLADHAEEAPDEPDLPPVRIFVMGRNQWRHEDQWPPPGAVATRLYLGSDGMAATDSDGRLGPDPPTDQAAYDAYHHNPFDPVPTVGGVVHPLGIAAGPMDQRDVERRDDVVIYTSPPLAEDAEVTGEVLAHLWVSSSAADTDFTAKLCDVHPGGLSLNICEGAVRTRRLWPGTTTQLEPGAVYSLRVDLWATSIVFARGHRIRLQVASSNFPHFDVNGGAPLTSRPAAVIADQRVFHDATRPSHLILPVLDSNLVFASTVR